MKKEDFNKAIIISTAEIIKKYPLASLKDIYKSFFQDEFGPGHLLTNVDNAKKYYLNELKNMKSKNRYSIENCGIGINFQRVNMDLIIEGIISTSDFFDLFIKSAQDFRLPELKEWNIKWIEIKNIIKKHFKYIQNFDSDALDIEKMLLEGKTQIDHSQLYKQEYEPHYRIMSIKYTKEILIKIKQL